MRGKRLGLILRALAATGALLVAACGDLPQPFRPIESGSNPLVQIPSGAGVTVELPGGFTPDAATAMAEALVENLRALDIPAETSAQTARLGYTLTGQLREREDRDGLSRLLIAWTLTDRTGSAVDRFQEPIYVETTSWLSGAPEALNFIANETAERIGRTLRPVDGGRIPVEVRRPWEGLTAQPEVTEAPGDGVLALADAMSLALRREGVQTAGGESQFRIIGRVEVSTYDASVDDIAVIWHVYDQNGTDLGEVRLDNRIPRGQLSGAWGGAAQAVVDAALPGILEILSTASD